ncbi:MAG: hypothetical protein R6U40_04690 [Desulfobacterales bacterium]
MNRFLVDQLKDFNIAVVIEARMSDAIDFFYKSVGNEKDEAAEGILHLFRVIKKAFLLKS